MKSCIRRSPKHLLGFVLVMLTAACSSPDSVAGPSDTSACDNGLTFAHLPVPLSAIASVAPLGHLGPPVHTIPTDHGGMYLNGTGITLVAPAAVRITSIRRNRYLLSPFRPGQSDYAVSAKLCGSYHLVLGHIVTVVDRIAAQASSSGCWTYSTSDETVESCENRRADVELASGATIGTVGGATAGAFDIGLYDSRQRNFYVNPGRYSGLTRTAICPYQPFLADVRDQLFARMREGSHIASGEEPVCGSMSVDVAGSAQGVWVLQSDPVSQSGNETNFLVLAPHPMAPVSRQTFSAGPSAIATPQGAPYLPRYPIQSSGRVNRSFKDIRADGITYCFVYDVPAPVFSYLVRLAQGDVLTIQRVNHIPGLTPCALNPATWSFTGAAPNFIR